MNINNQIIAVCETIGVLRAACLLDLHKRKINSQDQLKHLVLSCVYHKHTRKKYFNLQIVHNEEAMMKVLQMQAADKGTNTGALHSVGTKRSGVRQ